MANDSKPQAGRARDEDDPASDLLEEEDTGHGENHLRPWDPGKIRITTKYFSLRDVVDQISDHDIDLSPDFQRDYVWKRRQRTRLVESILLGIPLPAFYFNQNSDGKYQVVDGVQRLSTINLFMQNGHSLDQEDLEYLQSLHGQTYEQLDPSALRRFRSTQIVVHVIEPQTPDEVKYDIFSRVNTLGSPLSPQEIRHAMSKAQSRGFLKTLSELPSFDEATGSHYWRLGSEGGTDWVRDSGRMTNRELALRFCAFRNYSDDDYRQHQSLDAFLVEYTKRLDKTDPSDSKSSINLTKLTKDFDQAMQSAFQVLGKAAFRRWPPEQLRRGPINRAVFESQAIALADYSLKKLKPKAEEIRAAFRAAFDDRDYAKSVTVGTGDPRNVATRLNFTQDILRRLIK